MRARLAAVHGNCTAIGWMEVAVREIVSSPPEFGLIGATGPVLAFGVGLLVSRKLQNTKRRDIGRSLVAAGALSTIPAVHAHPARASGVERGNRYDHVISSEHPS